MFYQVPTLSPSSPLIPLPRDSQPHSSTCPLFCVPAWKRQTNGTSVPLFDVMHVDPGGFNRWVYTVAYIYMHVLREGFFSLSLSPRD